MDDICICINFKAHNDMQLHAISEKYDIDFYLLKQYKKTYYKIWFYKIGVYKPAAYMFLNTPENKKIFKDEANLEGLLFRIKGVCDCLNNVYFEKIRPIKCPKIPSYIKEIYNPTPEYTLNYLIDRLTECGYSEDGLNRKEKKALYKLKNKL